MEEFLQIGKYLEELGKYRRIDTSPKGASEKAILEVEEKLGVNFPYDYRMFLKKYGTLAISDHNFNGIYDDDPSLIGGDTIFGVTKRAREKIDLPDGLAVIFYDSYAQCLCLDLRRTKDEQQTCHVVYYGLKEHDIEFAYDSFLDYLTGYLKRTLDFVKKR